MKKHLGLGISFSTFVLLSLAALAPFSNQISDQNILPQPPIFAGAAQAASTQLLSQQLVSQNPSPPANLPLVDGKTWMSDENIPWSTPVSVWDNQSGNYRAVFDRNYPTGTNVRQIRQTGEISNWNRRFIGIYGYGTQKRCVVIFFVPVCDTKHPIYPVSAAALKIGSKVFPLQGENSRFVVSDELAYALFTAYPKKVLLRFTLADGSDTVTHPIGEATVKAWQVIYQNASPPAEQSSASLPPSGSGEALPAKIPSDLLATLPVVDGSTWRFNDNLPWSVPVVVKDEFDGNYIAVFDRDYQKRNLNADESGLISNWSEKWVWLHIYEISSGTTYRTVGVNAIDLKIGDRTFHLTSANNQFVVTDDLAQALRNAGSGQVQISFVDPQGKTITHPIGSKTIESWKTVYKAHPPQ